MLFNRYPNTESLTEGDFKGIGKLIEHPIPVYPSGEPNKPLSMQIYLTAEERKKLRKQRRREAELEKQEKIQLGLAEKPETKVSLNLQYMPNFHLQLSKPLFQLY